MREILMDGKMRFDQATQGNTHPFFKFDCWMYSAGFNPVVGFAYATVLIVAGAVVIYRVR
jgi:hypothetical protein